MKKILLMVTFLFGAAACNTVAQMEMSKIKNEPFVLDNTYKYARPTNDKIKLELFGKGSRFQILFMWISGPIALVTLSPLI